MEFLKRFMEPSTYAGLAAIALGVGQVADINEAPAVAEAITQGGAVVGGGGSPVMAGAVILGGLASIFMKEKGRR